MGVRVCGWQRVIVASGAAWAPCCYPATLQAGHAFSGFCGSAAAPFTALHHPVREHPAPHKRLHIRRARTHTRARARALTHAHTHTATDIAYPTYKPLPEYTSHHTHTHTHTRREYWSHRPGCSNEPTADTQEILHVHTGDQSVDTHLSISYTHTHTHTRTHQWTHPPIPCLSPPAAAVYITSHWLYPSWRLCLSRVCVCDVCVWCVCYWQLSLSISTNETVTFDVLCLDKSEW